MQANGRRGRDKKTEKWKENVRVRRRRCKREGR